MEKAFSGLDRIDTFAQRIIALISLGKKETISDIIQKMSDKKVIEYLITKYSTDIGFTIDNFPYDIEAWENQLSELSYITPYDANRKWGVVNENEGLLLLVSLILEVLRVELYR